MTSGTGSKRSPSRKPRNVQLVPSRPAEARSTRRLDDLDQAVTAARMPSAGGFSTSLTATVI